jgi:molecular chaperone GrpE
VRNRGRKIEIEEDSDQDERSQAEPGAKGGPDEAGDAGPVVETEQSKIERLEQELARRDQELAEAQDRYLRALADLDNLRKRAQRDQAEALSYGATSVIGEILPVLDNFERALKAAQEAGEQGPLVDGVAMIREQFLQVLEKRGIKPLEAVGQAFDPVYHEAIARVETADHPEGSVIEEVERGYQMGDAVLRPSKVVVAAAPQESE